MVAHMWIRMGCSVTSGVADAVTMQKLPRPTAAWLREVKVLVDGTSPTLDVAARVLAQLGARVERGKAAFASNDVVLVDRIGVASAIPGQPHASAEAYCNYVAETNGSVWVTTTAFGLSTGRANEFASDLTLLAAGGILGHSRIGEELAPTVPPGNLALKLTGYVMAVAALHAVHEFRATGSPVHVDVSARDSVIATGLTLEMAHALSNCPDEGGSARYGAPSGFFDCADGSIYVLVLEQHQWEAFRGVLSPLLNSVETLVDARDKAAFVNSQLASWTAGRSVEECERLLQAAGVPASEVNSLASLSERAAAAGRPVDLAGPDAAPLPAQMFVPDNAVAGPPGPIPLDRLRVLDAGHVLAVPLAAAWLGAMGAVVTKLEDPKRLDIYRRRGPFADGQPGPNRSAYFNQLNFSKTRLEVNVGEPGAGLDLDQFDVIVHNLTPRRARTVGVDLAQVLTKSPKMAIASSGYGGTGPWANYRAYGHNIHAFAGLVAATRDARGQMGDMGTPWADPLTSVAIAAWVLAWSLEPGDRHAVGVDISMAELTAAQIADLSDPSPEASYASAQVGGHFFLRPASGPLLAVSLRTEDEVESFQSTTGSPFPPGVGLGQELKDLTVPDDIEPRLRAAGIPAAPVLTAHELALDEDVRSTGLFASVSSKDLGTYEVTGIPWRFVGHPLIAAAAAPEVQT
jgi:crotonobetainyl-CoA:carnitine CoA-transferase CaiB-like acyl-CoA transferase